MTLYSLQRDLTGFNILEEVKSVITETSEEIAELNRGQLFLGKKSDDTAIVPEYAEQTIEFKSKQFGISGITDRVTLHSTGSFWRQITVEKVTNTTFDITSKDWKLVKLEVKYLRKILGLSKGSRGEYISVTFLPALINRIEMKTKMKFSNVL